MVFYAVQYSIDIIESGFCVFTPLLSVGYVVELLLQTAFFVHEPSCSFLVKGFHCFCGYSIKHFSELCVNFGNPHLQVEAVVIALFSAPIPELIDKKECDKIERKRRVRNERTKT